MDDNRIRNEEGLAEIKKKVGQTIEKFETRNRVSNTDIFLMLSVAGFFDLGQFALDWVPLFGWILSGLVGIFSWLTFYTWTSVKGWGFTDTLKKWLVYFLQALSVVPVFNAGLEIMAGTLLTILIVKSDDFIYNKTQGRVDLENIKQGMAFFKLFRNVDGK